MAENDNEYYEDQQGSEPGFKPAQETKPRETGASQEDMTREMKEEASSIKVEHGVVFNLPLCNTSYRKVVQLDEHYLVLYQHFVIYKLWDKVEEVDDEATEKLGSEEWRDKKYNYRWTRMRKDIMDVNMYWNGKEKLWAVEMVFQTVGTATWFFVNGKDAKKFHDVLQNYFITRDQK